MDGAGNYRLVITGYNGVYTDVAQRLAEILEAAPDQIISILRQKRYTLRNDLTYEEATRIRVALEKTGVLLDIEEDQPKIAINLPPNSVNSVASNDDNFIRRIADYKRISGWLFILLGIIQCLTVIGIIAGIWNIFAGLSRIGTSKKIRLRDQSVIEIVSGVAGLVVIGLINLIFGGVIGILFIAIDFYVRDQILSNRHLFDQLSANGINADFGYEKSTLEDGWFFSDEARRVQGPFSANGLRDLLDSGTVNDETLVTFGRHSAWLPLSKSKWIREMNASKSE